MTVLAFRPTASGRAWPISQRIEADALSPASTLSAVAAPGRTAQPGAVPFRAPSGASRRWLLRWAPGCYGDFLGELPLHRTSPSAAASFLLGQRRRSIHERHADAVVTR